MMRSTSTLALGLLLTFSAPCALAVAADPGEQILLDRAAYWRAQQRLDMATEMLNKLLRLNPNQPDALYQLGSIAAQRGDLSRAGNYFDRLRQMASSDRRAAELVAILSPSAPTAIATAPVPTAQPVKTIVAAAQPSVAANASPAAAPAHDLPELVAVSADSSDLTAVPAKPLPRAVAAIGDSQTLRAVQLASLSEITVSDIPTADPATAAPVREVESSGLEIITQPDQLAQLELLAPPPVGGYQAPAAAIPYRPTDTLEMDIDRSLAQIEQQSNPMWLGGFGFRWHDGTSGLNQLTEVGAPAQLSFSPWYTGTARLTVLPVYLDAGTLSTGNLNLFGTNPIFTARGFPAFSPGAQNAAGVGVLGGYTYQDFTGQIGTSPIGFLVTNIVGMAAYQPKFWDDTLSVRVEGFRQPVTDSLLSYAGTRAPVAGPNTLTSGSFGNGTIWGGVVKSGGAISAFYDDTMYGAYGSVSYGELTGENVASNDEFNGLLGAYFRPYKTDNATLRVGISSYYAGFEKNLSGFTYGQGGYFSPANFIAITFPVEYTGHNGPWSYLASAAIGVQHSNEDKSAIFPNNQNAQIALANTPGAVAFAEGGTTTGPAFNVKGQIEYAIDDTATIGAAVSFDNGNNYNEVIAKLYLRKTFDLFSPVASTSDPVAIARRDQPQSRL
jgi:hypothetical protein